MKVQAVQVGSAVGQVLCAPIFHVGGKKLLAKGHQIREEDVRLLSLEGHAEVVVAVIEEDEIPEDRAALDLATAAACGSLEIRLAAGGRVNLMATENCCLLLDEAVLGRFNESGNVSIATMPNYSFAAAGQRVASVKTAPFVIPKADFLKAQRLMKTKGPILQARPIRDPTVAILYSDPREAERARRLYEGIMKTRLDRFGAAAAFVLTAIEDENSVARALDHLLRARPNVVLMASTTAPAGPEDTVGRAIEKIGCKRESFLAPVEPGNLLLLSYAGDVPVVAAPGCFRSPRPNVVDLVLPPLLASYHLTAHEVSSLGHGGLLS
jgi:molybdenum cofactor cytidylyltransferase